MDSGLSASRSPGMTAIAGRASAKDSLAERLKPSLPAAPARAPERRRRRRRDEGREERDGAGKPQLDLPESALSLPATRFTHVGFPLLPPPARRSRVAGRPTRGAAQSGLGGASPRRFVDDQARLSMAALAQPPQHPRRPLASPSHPPPYPSPPLGFAERGEGAAGSRHV